MKNKKSQFALPCCAFAFFSLLTFGVFLVANGILDFTMPKQQASYQEKENTELDELKQAIKKLESKTYCHPENCEACEYAECSSLAGCWWKEGNGNAQCITL